MSGSVGGVSGANLATPAITPVAPAIKSSFDNGHYVAKGFHGHHSRAMISISVAEFIRILEELEMALMSNKPSSIHVAQHYQNTQNIDCSQPTTHTTV